MSDANYDEVTNSVYQADGRDNIDPMFHWDLHFPERISRLSLNSEFSSCSPASRRNRRPRDRCSARYKTQPITFDEITEVDEDTTAAAAAAATAAAASASSPPVEDEGITQDMKMHFKNTMTGFSRSMDGLVIGSGVYNPKKGGTGSDKENTPCEGDRLSNPAQLQEGGSAAVGGRENQQLEGAASSARKDYVPSADYFRSVGCPVDGVRHRRKKLNRKLHYRNTVEELPETEKVEETENA